MVASTPPTGLKRRSRAVATPVEESEGSRGNGNLFRQLRGSPTGGSTQQPPANGIPSGEATLDSDDLEAVLPKEKGIRPPLITCTHNASVLRCRCLYGVCFLIAILVLLRFQTGGNPRVLFKTDVVSSVPLNLLRSFSFRVFRSSRDTVPQIPSKEATTRLLDPNLRTDWTDEYLSEQRRKFPSFNSCSAQLPTDELFSSPLNATSIGSLEWRDWVHKRGTSNALFQTSTLPNTAEEQEFPIFKSSTPCGIHQSSAAQVGPFKHRVVASSVQGKGNGAVLVVRLDKEGNLGHTLREGVLICVYLLRRQLEISGAPMPLSLYVFFPEEAKTRLKPQQRNYKVNSMKAFGKVRLFDGKMAMGSEEISYFERVYEAPWNTIEEGTYRGVLAGGWLQGLVGDISLRLSMSHIIVNRKPLKMYTGFSKAVRTGLQVPVRQPNTGAVVLIQRGIYGYGAPDHEAFERRKQRLLVDSVSGTREGLLHHLCMTGLPILEVDFHPAAKINKIWDQVAIMAQAAVLVSPHGSGMWNAVWMLPGSVAVEVLLRPGHCCFPIPSSFTGVGNKNICKSPCKPYTMINIADGIMASGVHWIYYDPEIIDQPSGDTNRETARVHVNGPEFAQIVKGAHALATQG